MTPDRWRQIEQVYQTALEREESDRSGYLDRACAGDDDLRREVESLLASHERAGSFIESPPDDLVAGMIAEAQARSMIGRTLGHYQLRSRVGAGGMGEVYLAQDLHLGRKVALKLLLKEFTLDRERVHRFHQEVRAASGLNHPNIITIYEIGEIGEAHFIATEFVEGSTLRQRMESNRLKLHVTLDVAIQVASASVSPS